MKRNFLIFAAALASTSATLLPIESSLQAATITWTNIASGGWNSVANWSPNQVPGANDTAVITNLGVTVSLNGGTTVGGITLGGFFVGTTTLSLNGQTLGLNGPLTVYPSGSFTVNSGSLVGNTNAVLSGIIGWTSSFLGGTLTLAPGSIINVTSGNNHDMPGCIFTNNGTVAWANGTIRGGNGAVFYNYGLFDAQSDQSFCFCGYGGNATFNNYGTLRKSGGAGEFSNSTLIQVPFNQLAGVIDVQNGTNGLGLAFQSGGNFTGGYITTNQFGLTVLSIGSFSLNGTVTGTNTWENNGNLVGNNVINGALTWVGGWWNSAAVTIASNSKIIVAGGGGNMDVNGAAVTNNGTVAWASGTIRGGNGTVFYNYGLFDAQSDQNFNNAYGGAATVFNNYGTFRKSGGASEFANATLFQGGVVFNQLAGVIDVQNGTNGLQLAFQSGGNFTGGHITTNQSGLTVLSVGSFTLNGTVTGTNTWENNGNLVGNNVINGGLTWVGSGNVSLWNNSIVTILSNSTVIVTGGSQNDLNAAVVTNYGTVAWASGTIRGGTGATIYNYGLWDAQSDQNFNNAYGGAATVFNNYGTFRKSGGASEFANATLFQGGVVFNQLAGVIDVQNGTNGLQLAFQSGGNFTGGHITTNQSGLTVLSVGSFTLNGTVTGTNTWENNGNLVGNNVINGGLTWVGSGNVSLWNNSIVTILSNSTVIVTGGSQNDLNAAVVTNYGTVAWASGTIRGGTGATIYNYGLWDAQSDQNFNNAYGGAATVFNNYGTFRKSGGANLSQTLFAGGVYLNQRAGSLDVRHGNFVLQGSGSLTGGTATNAAGNLYLSSGDYNVNGTLTGSGVIENAANLTGNNVISGALTWIAGNWNDTTLTILSNSTMIVAGGGNNDLARCTMTNYGTVNWASGTLRGGGNPGTTLYNYGLWNAQSDQTFNSDYAGAGVNFKNFGTFRKSAGTNASAMSVFFNNNGTIDALSGALNFNSGASLTAGLLNFGIDSTSTFGQINIAGPVNLTGGVGAVLLNGYTPPIGTNFVVMHFGAASGTFTDYSKLNVGGGIAFNPVLAATTFTLTTVATNFTAVAPSIINQPASQTANYGDTVTLSTTVSGSPVVTFQWHQNNTALPGATNATLTLSNITFAQAGAYKVGVTNSAGGLLSQTAQLTVNPVIPAFTLQPPANVTVPAGTNVTFNVAVIGGPPPTLQWQHNGTNLLDAGRVSGVHSTALSISNVLTGDAGNYLIIASNAYGVATSSTTVLHVGFSDIVPYAITPPANAILGQTIQLVFNITNQASGKADGPWLNQFLLAQDTNGTGAYNLGTISFSDSVPAFSSVAVTQSVIMPATIFGPRYLGVILDSGNNLFEITKTNNTAYSVNAIQISGADLVLQQITAPASAQYGQSINVSFAVTNIGAASAIAGWNDQIYFSSTSNSLSGATLLATLAGSAPLAPGAGYARNQSVTIPETSSSTAGTFYLIAAVDVGNGQLETNKANNLLSIPIMLSLPPLPDLVAGQVSSPTNATAGQSIPVMWAVTNIGSAAAIAPWQEKVYLVPASLTLQQFNTNAGAYPTLGVFTYTNNFGLGASAIRTQQVTLPLIGLAGDLRAATIVNSDSSVLEGNSTNNSALALNDLQVPTALSLSLPVTNILENTATPILACLVSRNGSLASPAIISLASSTTNHLLVPASVTIPAGAASAPFNANVLDDGVPGPDALVTISATAGGYLSSTSKVTIVNTDVPYLSLLVASSQITEGQTVLATVTNSTVGSQPLVVSITRSSSSALSIPSSVTIPANSNSISFTVLAVQNTFIAPAQTYTINASAGGYAAAAANLTVLNNNTPTLTLSLDNTNINETDGPFAAIGTVSRLPVTDQSVTIALANTNSNAATVPAQVTIPSLQGSISFYVAAVNDTNVTGPKATVISAQALDNVGNPVGSAVTQSLVVQDASGPSLKVTIANKVVAKGLNPATTAMVSVATPPTNNLVVTLTSSATSEATVPVTVTILAGQSNATFNITSLNDGLPSTSHQVTITASASNYASGSDVLAVTDIGLPDLVIASITLPATAYTAESLTIGFRLLNQGLGTLTNGVNQNVYLTQDPASTSYFPMGTTYFPGPLAAGQYVDESLIVPGNAVPLPGIYSVVVIADANNNAVELNEVNNNLVSKTPVVISPEYTALVEAGAANVLSGTPVPLTGSATLAVGGPATNKLVNILVTVRGLQRVISVTTDASGHFNTVFNPLPMEAGSYTVAAVFPGITSAPAQDQFNILGMSATPVSLNLNVTEGSNVVGAVSLQNLGEVPLSGLVATVNGLAANLQSSTTFTTNYLDSQGAITLLVNIAATDSSIRLSSGTIHLTSGEGAMLDVPVNVSVNALTPNLVSSLSPLNSSMLRGAQTILRFDLINNGGAPTGPLTINLPSVPWLSVASTNPMPSIAPGATNHVTLLLSPDANLALGPYTGFLAVNGNDVGLQVPFTFTAVSDAHGALSIRSVDEYTYFATGSPPLTNATVTLLDPFTRAVVVSGITDSNGLFNTYGVMEGVYELDLSADQHVPFRGKAVVAAGQTNSITAFLSRQTVTFVWTVVPTSIQDTTHITIQATFETDVPAPVVVPNPASIDLAPLTQPGQFMDIPFTLVNYGLIAVHDVAIHISQHPLYRFDLVTTTVGDLAAHGTVTIPMRITRLAGPSAPAGIPAPGNAPPPGAPCNINFGLDYSYPCGPFGIEESVQITVLNVSGDCATTPGYSSCSVSCVNCGSGDGGYGFIYNPNNAGRGSSTVQVPPEISLPPSCDPCWDAFRDCAIGIIPVVGCIYSVFHTCVPEAIATVQTGTGTGKTVEDCTFTIIGCLPGGELPSCIQTIVGGCFCPGTSVTECVNNFLSGSGGGGPSATGLVPGYRPPGGDGGGPGSPGPIGSGFSSGDLRDVYLARSYVLVHAIAMIIGDTDGRWFSPGSGGAFAPWFSAFQSAVQTNSPAGPFISPDEATNLLSLPFPNTITNGDVVAAINRWNLTVTNWKAGIFSATNVPPGGDTNFLDLYAFTNQMTMVSDQMQISQAAGFNSPYDGLIAAVKAGGVQAGSTCARVVLQIDQDAVLTRDAFRATLKLNNGSTDPLSNVSVNLVVQNQSGQDVMSLFGVEAPSVSGGLTAVDGTGSLSANGSGNAQWTLIPSLDAAPQAPTNYLVSGTFSYVDNGVTVSIQLAPAPINVQPNPELHLKYFLQRDVFADDPFTPGIEPSIPFPLAVMVENRGYGAAHNFQITSAQPKIIDNEKGLLINFKIIGTQVAGQPETPSLTADFGEMAPQSVKIGQWLFISSLQGLFIDYKATFEHIDPLGNPRLSLIQGVEIHQTTHMVQAEGAWDDGQPDFLTVETLNFGSLPDTLYLSDGTKQPVSVVQTGSTDGAATASHLQVQFTANYSSGFTYVIVPDPANGQFPLIGVKHGNGTNFLAPNFYTTDRTFIGLGQKPIRENMLHLFDYHTNAGPDTYTLVYAIPLSLPDTNPPVSAVFALQPQSPPTFGVAWGGADFVGESGLAFFDIYSADNGGSYTIWQSHTNATGAFFSGANGHTYAFYSIATDNAGNREAIPLQPQAQTTVNSTNYPPTISVSSNVTLNAGDTLSLYATASDPNIFDNLTFSLGSGAPAGMNIDPNSGLLTWPTSPAFGATTNHISIIVSDNQQPPLTATGVVTVIVLKLVSPPILAPIPNYTIAEGTLLTVTNSAIETNIPPRALTFSLGVGAPTNATINPVTGLFQWRPTIAQAPSTNNIVIIVTDDGVPPLSATRQFRVVVRAATFEFLLGLGSTNVLVGSAASVPVTLQSLLPLTNITAIMQVPDSGLTNWTLLAASPEITSTLLQQVSTNQYAITLTLNPALSPGDSRTLAQLAFLSEPQAHSAFVPLNLPLLSGVQSDGSIAPKPGTANGRVVVIARESLLEAWFAGNSKRKLTLYGIPGASYELDYTTNLLNPDWQFGWRWPLTNLSAVFDANASLPQVFYRAVEFSANPPILELNSSSKSNLVLLLYGQSGTNYSIMTGTNLENISDWSSLVGFTLTNSFRFISTGAETNQMQFFRAKKP